jgi:hypothetical protein
VLSVTGSIVVGIRDVVNLTGSIAVAAGSFFANGGGLSAAYLSPSVVAHPTVAARAADSISPTSVFIDLPPEYCAVADWTGRRSRGGRRVRARE